MTLTELAHAARRISLYQDFTITFFCIGAPACVAITLLDAGGIVITVAWAAILLGAIWVHSGNGWVFTSANGGWEYPAFLAVITLVHVALGDGAYALSRRKDARPPIALARAA